MTKDRKKDHLLGALDLLILRVLSTKPNHGYGIARRIEQISSEVLSVQQGSLYPALHRLEKKAFIQSEWRTGETSKPIRTYTLTSAGEAYLADEISNWELFSAAVNVIIKEA
ncbi:transcriptional regulator, PadR family, putative [Verrucomicrobiia bacterium DG1235]|nr:transcriptional regulator, PadR family, putative [Verrucomicrobiae bacterium DG1235]